MQSELKTVKSKYMRVLDEAVVYQEETGEVYIPDSQPDIVKVVDTFSNVLLKSKEAETGRAVIKGILQVTVLYSAQDEGVYHVIHSMPFTVTVNRQAIVSECSLTANVEAAMSDAVITNTRKLIVRINLKTSVTCFVQTEHEICTGIDNDEVFQKIEDKNIICMSEYTEKMFVISDDAVLNKERAVEFEIMGCECRFKDIGYSVSGSRVIIKGTVDVRICWISIDDTVPKVTKKSIEFSQLLDADMTVNTESVCVSMMMTGCYCDVNSLSNENDITAVAVEIHAVAQCELFDRKETAMLADLYMTTASVKSTWENIECICGIDRQQEYIKIDECISKKCDIEDIISWRISFGDVFREEDKYSVTGYVSVYGYNGDMEMITAKSGFQVSCSGERQCVDITVTAENSAIEIENGAMYLRCDAVFSSSKRNVEIIKNLTEMEAVPDDIFDNMPSIVLCRAKKDDTLWELGKRYRSSTAMIKTVNEIADNEDISEDRLLLIPKL